MISSDKADDKTEPAQGETAEKENQKQKSDSIKVFIRGELFDFVISKVIDKRIKYTYYAHKVRE